MGEPHGYEGNDPHCRPRMTFRDKNYIAQRLLWETEVGPIPDGLWVLHKCDNGRCCNPAHLFLGTASDNVQDMLAKGRGGQQGDRHHLRRDPSKIKRGAKSPVAILTDEQVSDIRIRYAAGGIGQKALAEAFGVSEPTVRLIVIGKTWTDTEGPTKPSVGLKWNREIAEAMRSEARAGKRVGELARQFGVDQGAVSAILAGKRWADETTVPVPEKPRGKKGEANYFAKLTQPIADEIRATYVKGAVTQVQLAERYGVTQGAVSLILRGKVWLGAR
jgi:DNA-binding MarR family transcriptional regulator